MVNEICMMREHQPTRNEDKEMITEEEKKQLLDDLEKARNQHWLEMMADI